jgi:hypothetical protein
MGHAPYEVPDVFVCMYVCTYKVKGRDSFDPSPTSDATFLQ